MREEMLNCRYQYYSSKDNNRDSVILTIQISIFKKLIKQIHVQIIAWKNINFIDFITGNYNSFLGYQNLSI